MKRVIGSYLLFLCALASARVTVPFADGKDACVAKEVSFRLAKTAYKNVVAEDIEYSRFWGSYSFTGKVNGEAKYKGSIYMKFEEGRDTITCDLEFRPNWVLPQPWNVFTLYDENDRLVAHRMSELRVKGKRYRF